MSESPNSGDRARREEPPAQEPPDAAEIWGKRVGRALGVAFAIFLIWRLLSAYVFKQA